jgi:hypothetical protein
MAKAMAVIVNIPTTVFFIFSLLETKQGAPTPSAMCVRLNLTLTVILDADQSFTA